MEKHQHQEFVAALLEQIKYVVLKLLQLQDLGIMVLAVIVVKQLALQH